MADKEKKRDEAKALAKQKEIDEVIIRKAAKDAEAKARA